MNAVKEISFLKDYLEQTIIISNAILASDVDVVLSALENRERLIQNWEVEGTQLHLAENAELIRQIRQMDAENDLNMEKFKDRIELKRIENRRKTQNVKMGKNISNKYQKPYSAAGGRSIDQKR